MSRRCRLGFHRWGIVTWPIGVAWCERCGKRWPRSRFILRVKSSAGRGLSGAGSRVDGSGRPRSGSGLQLSLPGHTCPCRLHWLPRPPSDYPLPADLIKVYDLCSCECDHAPDEARWAAAHSP